MNLVVLGINYQTAPLAVREQLAFSPLELPAALRGLLNESGVFEAAIISTCNRTELYCNARDADLPRQWLAGAKARAGLDMGAHLYIHQGDEAVRHVFRVAAGLDSMVVGETQILGQIKEAERTAREVGSLGLLLNGLFQRAFSVAKEVRSQTRIGAESVSMAAAAVKIAERIFPSVAETRVLFIGAGEMIELCARYFHAQSPRNMAIANRTLARGETLAQEFGAEAMLLADLSTRLAEFDIVVSSTASTLPIVGKGMVERAIKARKRRPILFVDLAVPRDVEAEVGMLADAYLYTVDDLADVVRQGVQSRQDAAQDAERIIRERVADFGHWMASRALAPTIRDLKDHAERISRHEVGKAMKRLSAGESPEQVLEELARQLANKHLHAPLSVLNAAGADEQDELVKLIRRLYRLHDLD